MSEKNETQKRTAKSTAKSKKALIAVVAAIIIIICCAVSFSAPKQSNLVIGTTIEFGSMSNEAGAEPIEWLVIGERDGMSLLLSKNCLAAMPYDSKADASQNWESSTLRAYLNGEFLESSFSAEERERIYTAELSNAFNAENSDTVTEDKIFILSDSEIQEFIPEEKAGDWLKAGMAGQEDSANWWWLRAPGFIDTYASLVKTNGAMYSRGESVINELGGVRPALWIKAA